MASKEQLLFKTPYGERKRINSETGSPYDLTYGYEINKYGQKELIITGETDRYAKIQESLEETKIENILKSVAMGDMSHMRPDGIYADLTEVPNNLIEARRQMNKLENLWNELPKEIKQKYNWSVEEFIGASGTENWLKDMGILKEEPKAEVKTEPKTDEKQGVET